MHYTINGEMPGPLLSATQGETFIVTVINKLPVTIGMHWWVILVHFS
jgi:FtsP/CotA-like multicopper oxidase with cupredoxin domain